MALEPPTSEPEPASYPHKRFVVLLIILVLLVAMVSVAQRIPTPGSAGPAFSEKALEGDTSIKFAYAAERWQTAVSRLPGQRQQMEVLYYRQRLAAITSYQQEVETDPTPANVRRLIIIQYPAGRLSAIRELEKLAKMKHSDGLAAEAVMWRAIYLSKQPLSSKESAGYVSRIRTLDLGWYESLALSDLYRRAGFIKESKAEMDNAINSAFHTATLLMILLAVVGTLGFIGIFVIVWYVNAERSGRLRADDELPSENRSLVAGYFLETFVVYLAVVIGTQVLAGVALAGRTIAGSPPGPKTIVFATAGVYALGGVLAAIYLAVRLKAARWSWKMIGLTSRNPLQDIGWGMLGYAAALPLLLIASLLAQILGRYIPTPSNPIVPIFVESNTLIERLVLLALTTVAAPFFEETFFRGVLSRSFRAKWGVRLGIIISAAVFAAVHPLPLGFLPIFVLGYILATLLYRRGSLLPCMVMHGLNNCVAFIALSILTGSK